tara:strand:- start:1116 stop:1631 length:516 start_codon:yes stop_codon:yes gene_type:complete
MIQLDKPIVFVGLMGAGKTRLGRTVAQELGLEFFDSDREIEMAAGCSISDIFEVYGEPAFRDVERKVMDRLLSEDRRVISTGGGAFMTESVRHMIKDRALSIWLNANLDVLFERTSRTDHRPLLQTGDPKKILDDLMKKRAPIYALADHQVDSGDRPINQIVSDIVEIIKS